MMGRPLKPRVFDCYLIEDVFDRIQELGLTLGEVERKARMSKSSLSHIASLRKGVNLRTFKRLTQALGLKLVLVEAGP